MFIEQPPLLYRILFPEAVWRIKRKKRKVVYLTFDDGPIPEVTPWVLDLLDYYGIKATFFLVGDNVKRNPHLLEEIKKRGHSWGNHTMNHPMCHLTGLGTDDIRSQIDDATNAIKDIAGQAPQVLRPVGGGVNSDVKAVAAELGYPLGGELVGTMGGERDRGYRCLQLVRHVVDKVVFHLG